MQKYNGFTLIELLVVIAVIGILSILTIIGYISVQKQSRDSQRAASAVVVAEGLEKYHAQNGAYPAVKRVTASDANAVKQLLKLSDIKSLATSGTTTNAWKAGTATATNKLTYTSNTDASNMCLTGLSVDDTCSDFKLQYYNEDTGTVVTILNRN